MKMNPTDANDVQRFFLHLPEGDRLYVCVVDEQRRAFDFTDNTFKGGKKLAHVRDACLPGPAITNPVLTTSTRTASKSTWPASSRVRTPKRFRPREPRLAFIGYAKSEMSQMFRLTRS